MIFEDPQSNYQKTVNNLLSKRDFDFDRQLEFKDILGSLFLGLAPAVIQGAIQGVNQRKFQRNKQIEVMGQNAVDQFNYDYAEGRRKLNIPEIELYDDSPETYLTNKAEERLKNTHKRILLRMGDGDLDEGLFKYQQGNEADYNKSIREYQNHERTIMDQKKQSPYFTFKPYEVTNEVREAFSNLDVEPETLVSIIADRISGQAAAEVETEININKLLPKFDDFYKRVKSFETNKINQLNYLVKQDSNVMSTFLNNAGVRYNADIANAFQENIYERLDRRKGDDLRADRLEAFGIKRNGFILNSDGTDTGLRFEQPLRKDRFDMGLVDVNSDGLFTIEDSNESVIQNAIAIDLSKIMATIKATNEELVKTDKTVLPLPDAEILQLGVEYLQKNKAFVEIDGKRGYRPLFDKYVSNPEQVLSSLKVLAETGEADPNLAYAMLNVEVAESVMKKAPTMAQLTSINKIDRINYLTYQLKNNRQLDESNQDEFLEEIAALKVQVRSLKDADAGVLQNLDDKEIADRAITEFLLNRSSDTMGYAKFKNFDGNEQLINITTHFSGKQGKEKLLSLFEEEYGADEDLRNLISMDMQEEEIAIDSTEELFGEGEVTETEEKFQGRNFLTNQDNITTLSELEDRNLIKKYLPINRTYLDRFQEITKNMDLSSLSNEELAYLAEITETDLTRKFGIPENYRFTRYPFSKLAIRNNAYDTLNERLADETYKQAEELSFMDRPMLPQKGYEVAFQPASIYIRNLKEKYEVPSDDFFNTILSELLK
tara:strand:- start:4716 stop:7034 length:2319 start_codon:yes stop_codon:yes gene_type:complete